MTSEYSHDPAIFNLRRHDSFEEPLLQFKRTLTDEENLQFSSVSRRDVHVKVLQIQTDLEAVKGMPNFVRLLPFLDAMEQFEKVIQVFPEAPNWLSFIWGPMKQMLSFASDKLDLLEFLLDAYEQIGDKIPYLHEHSDMFQKNPAMMRIVGFMYADLLDFHQKTLRLYSGQGRRRKFFRSMWKDFHPLLQHLLGRLAHHRESLAEQARMLHITQGQSNTENILAHIEQYAQDRLEQMRRFAEDEERRRTKDFLEVCEWLSSSSDTIADHETFCRTWKEFPTTGNWFLENDKIQNWDTGDPPVYSTIWVHAIPGAGKTILASKLISHCKLSEDASTAYFYCKETDDQRRDCLSIYKGLLGQLLINHRDLVPYFSEKRTTSGTVTLTSQLLAEQLLSALFEADSRFYIIIDGLDECEIPQIQLLMAFMNKMVKQCDELDPGKLRLALISQNIKEIKDTLPKEVSILQLTHTDNKEDIETYVNYKCDAIMHKTPSLSMAQRDYMWHVTCVRSKGMFLFAKLVMENLEASETLDDLIYEIQEDVFPENLLDAYKRILQRLRRKLHKRQWAISRKLLGWIICAKRPLKWKEIQAIISIDPREEAFNFERSSLNSDIQMFCGSLITLLPGDQPNDHRVELVHVTAMRCILQTKLIQKPLVQLELASLCLRYLRWACFDMEVDKTHLKELALDGQFVLQDYVVSKWSRHVADIVEIDPTELDHLESGNSPFDMISSQLLDFEDNFEDELLSEDPGLEEEKACRKFLEYDFHPNLLRLWNHINRHDEKGLAQRNEPSIKSLNDALTRNRKLVEEIVTNSKTSGQEVFDHNTQLIFHFYSKKVFKCPKLTCFYFYAGWMDAKTRDAHVKKHNRPFECTFPDCTMKECGWVSNKDLEKHVKFFHPEAGDLANMFPTNNKKRVAEARWNCTICNKRFTRGLNLRAHQRAHTGEKPYACSECGKAFTRANDCKRHEKGHAIRR